MNENDCEFCIGIASVLIPCSLLRLDAARKMLKAEGLRGFYRGLAPNLVGIIPEKAIKLAVNDYARERWGLLFNDVFS